MATSGTTIENPVSGTTCRWHLTAADTGGALMRCEMRVRPGGGHDEEGLRVHPHSEERFEVLSGQMEVRIGSTTRVLGPGGRAVVPPNVAHAFKNAGDDELHFFIELTAPGRFEEFIELYYGMARDGRLKPDGSVALLTVVPLAKRYSNEIRAASPPWWVQRLMFAALTPAAAIAARLRRSRAEQPGPAASAPTST
jgi:mannose-6-phosphate isomerase-like protein (cupin superfamily)